MTGDRRPSRSLVRSTGILALGNSLNRVLGVAYRMVLSRVLGAEGLGMFQMGLSLYFAVISPFIAGLPAALSQVLAEQRARIQDPSAARLLLQVIAVSLGLLGVAGALLMTIDWRRYGANWRLVADQLPLELLLPAMAFAIIAVSIRGAFYAEQEVAPVIKAQLGEQLAHLLVLMPVLWLPALSQLALGQRLTLVLWNLVIGEFISALLILRAYRHARRRPLIVARLGNRTRRTAAGGPSPQAGDGAPLHRSPLRATFKLAVPIGLQRTIGGIQRLVEATLIPLILQQSGVGLRASIAAYGELTGMVLPLLLMPSVIVQALDSTLVPGVAEVRRRPERLKHRVQRALLLTAEMGLVTALALVFAGGVLTQRLFAAELEGGYPYAGRMAALFAPMAAFLYLDRIAVVVLRGLGRATAPLLVDLFSVGLRLGLLLVLGRHLALGVPGIAVAMIVSLAAGCALDVALAAHYSGLGRQWQAPLLRLFVCAGGGYAAGRVIWEAFAAGPGDAAGAVMATGAALAAYGLLRLGSARPRPPAARRG